MKSKYEAKAQKELEKEGCLVDWKVHPYRVPKGYNVDFFGLYDILALQGTTLRMIAIKGHMGVPRALRKGIEGFHVEKIQKEIWTFREGKKESKKETIS